MSVSTVRTVLQGQLATVRETRGRHDRKHTALLALFDLVAVLGFPLLLVGVGELVDKVLETLKVIDLALREVRGELGVLIECLVVRLLLHLLILVLISILLLVILLNLLVLLLVRERRLERGLGRALDLGIALVVRLVKVDRERLGRLPSALHRAVHSPS